eukprot:NODE_3152_length_485_cov_435.137615_g2735_i0.p5 GENE.NODE_3152_length_485_cov_435.137615_g2735_i0~~NODE_3152_length_485_cov_435.137615_g2735_i0.p5  ORF type:complete len:54 (+),score=24.84 NODE_3152_length_485_cov_435.137615_g2735_i0:28-189(+)
MGVKKLRAAKDDASKVKDAVEALKKALYAGGETEYKGSQAAQGSSSSSKPDEK